LHVELAPEEDVLVFLDCTGVVKRSSTQKLGVEVDIEAALKRRRAFFLDYAVSL
jgi:hypothetical protein